MNNRNYGIDLLKIIAMLMVVLLHVMRHGGVTELLAKDSHSFAYGIEQLFNTFCLCAVNCFVLSTGYIMCRREFKWIRIVRLWGQVAFYSVGITGIAFIVLPKGDITKYEWIKSFMPISFNLYWFMTMYVALFVTIPVLNHIFGSLDIKKLDAVIYGGFILLSFYPSLIGHDLFGTRSGYSYLWFMYLYIVGGWMSMCRWRVATKSYLLTGIVVICTVGSLSLEVLSSQCHKLFGVSCGHWLMYSSPGILLEALALLMMFSRIDIKNSLQRIIMFISPSVFAVYLIHDNSLMKKMVNFHNIGTYIVTGNSCIIIAMIIGIAVIIFVLCLMIDLLRRCLVKNLKHITV